MPWKERSIMMTRKEFVELALAPEANISKLSAQYGISRTCAYKWIDRYKDEGVVGLLNRKTTPHASPYRTAIQVEDAILEVRSAHPAWGARKIRAFLLSRGHAGLPAVSTITEILRRNGQLDPQESQKHKAFIRFERSQPNELWQLDCKGYFQGQAGKIFPLDLIDDHSRYCLCLRAQADIRRFTVQQVLTETFRTYGLPEAILCDNGSPWGDSQRFPYTRLGVWLLRLGVQVLHGRPFHPQTQGKLERFHRTLELEAIRGFPLLDEQWQAHFDRFRWDYNHNRPHEALGLEVPVSRYTPSPVSFPEVLSPVEFVDSRIVRKVYSPGFIHFQGREIRFSKGFLNQPVCLCPSTDDGCYDVFYGNFKVAVVDMKSEKPTVNYVSERV